MSPWIMSGKAGGTGDGTAVTERLARYEARFKLPEFRAYPHPVVTGFPPMMNPMGMGMGSMFGPQTPQGFIQYLAMQQQEQVRRNAALFRLNGADE